MTPNEIERKLTELFTPCGLNADWCVSAWHILGTTPNIGKGVYLLDQEDGTWTLTWRHSDEHDDHVIELAEFTTNDVVQWLALYANPKALIRLLAWSNLCNYFKP